MLINLKYWVALWHQPQLLDYLNGDKQNCHLFEYGIEDKMEISRKRYDLDFFYKFWAWLMIFNKENFSLILYNHAVCPMLSDKKERKNILFK